MKYSPAMIGSELMGMVVWNSYLEKFYEENNGKIQLDRVF